MDLLHINHQYHHFKISDIKPATTSTMSDPYNFNVNNTPHADQTSSTGAVGGGVPNSSNPPTFTEPTEEERKKSGRAWHDEEGEAMTNVGNTVAQNDLVKAGSTMIDWAGPQKKS